MVKHCNQCNEDYPDDFEDCPRCATARITHLAKPKEDRNTQLAEFHKDPVAELPATEAELDMPSPRDAEAAGDSGVDLAEVAEEDLALSEPLDSEAGEEAVVEDVEGDDSSVKLGASPEDSGEGVWAEDGGEAEHPASGPHEEVVAAAGDSGIDLSERGQPARSASDAALAALQADDSMIRQPAESGRRADDPYAGMEDVPEESGVEHEASALDELEEPAAQADEEAAVEETEEDEKPAKPAKPRSQTLILASTALGGILLGALGTIGTQSLLGPSENPKAGAPAQPNQIQLAAPKQEPPKFEAQAARVASGDWEEAHAAGIEMIQGANTKEWVALGEYHLGTYLKKVGGKIDLKDPSLQTALQNLQKAAEQKDPDAVYDLALVKELAGQLPEALVDYAKGAETFANDPVQKQRFASAVARVEWKVLQKGSAHLPLPPRKEDRTVVLALLLLALQQPPDPPGQPPQQPAPPAQPAAPADKEAGYEFWNATKLAREGKFSDAIRTLDEARKLHDQRRFTRLRKAQNPLSDPAEDIFLRCCAELKTYWRLQDRLRDGGYLADKNTAVDALQALLQKAESGGAMAKSFADKLVAAQVIGKDEDPSKGLDRLISEKKNADTKLAELKTMLQSAQDAKARAEDKLTALEKAVAERDAALNAAKKDNEKLKTSVDEMNATLKEIRGQLAEAQLLGNDPDKANVVEAVKRAVEVAKAKDTQGLIRQQRDEIARLSASMKGSRPPGEMMPLWLLLLDENRERTELADKAMKDVESVQKDPQASPARKGEAEVVYGLALRNTEQFAKSKLVLEAARGMVELGSEFHARASAALKEVSYPAAYYSSLAQDLYDHGRLDSALSRLERAIKVLPATERGKLLAKRSLIELEAAQAKVGGPLPATEPLLIAARRDADEAVTDGSAEGHYAAGRIAEALGQMDAAIKSYRAALVAHANKMDADGGRYRMALARVLLFPREARPALPLLPPPGAQKVGWRDPAPYPAKHFDDMKRLVWMFAFGLQPPLPLLPAEDVGQEEAERLADEVLRAPPGTVPFNVLAQALAVKGRWTEALRVYVEGIRPLLPREIGNGLLFLILNDPRLRRPDVPRIPNPMEAEKHFAAGLNFYFADDYANGEKEFLLTIENDSQDARFFYFLGLSRLAQNRRREAGFDFEQGAILERLDRPSPAAVNVSLERIQGTCRTILNEFRQQPVTVK